MLAKTVALYFLKRFQNVHGNLIILQACKKERNILSDSHRVCYSYKGKALGYFQLQ
jgi:hypothetical protein